jgi:hypothetical protein
MATTADVTIDAARCPTCNEDRYIMYRGNRVDCPTCCAVTRLGELQAVRPTSLSIGRMAVLFTAGAAAVAAGMVAIGSGWLW